MVEGTAFVGVWIALGYLLPVDTNVYLLLGVPLTLAFQLGVRRRPLRELWMRDDGEFRLDRFGLVLAVVLVVAPVVATVDAVRGGQWSGVVWGVVAAAGAVPAAWAFRRTRFRTTLREALPATLVGAVLMGLFGTLTLLLTGREVDPLAMLGNVLFSALLYVPVVFVLEEVAFRGALDPHVQRLGERGGVGTALLVSALWAVWHLPIAGAEGVPFWMVLAQLLLLHVLVGIPLSYAWRRTGSLAAPGLAHALIDGVRNGLQA
jgi:membrane protease YdiL (CAAX protease family)